MKDSHDSTEHAPIIVAGLSATFFGQTFRISRFTYLLALGVLVGLLTGLVTIVFREAATLGHKYMFPYRYQEGQMSLFTIEAIKRVTMPIVGGLVSGLLLYRIGHFTGSHSIPAILRSVASGRNIFKPRMAVPPAVALVTLATGGSAGPEGPIAELGSVLGSLIGQWAKAPPQMMKTLIGAGVAAGIAAVFNAPIGGVFFAIEVILRNYEVASFTPIVAAAVTSSVIANAVLGNEGMALTVPYFDVSTRELPYFVALGLLCGGLSTAFVYGLDYCRERFHRLPVPLWIKPAIGGLAVGLVGLFFPRVMGEGYEWIRNVIAGEGVETRTIGLLMLLVFVKTLATGLTLGSGNPGGSFAPAVFVGVMGGAAMGSILAHFHLVAGVTAFAVMGMSGLIAGALGAPVTGIMIALRFTGSSSIGVLLALMTTCVLCMFVMQFSKNVSVYTLEFVRLGIDLDRARETDPLSLVAVRTVMHATGFEELAAGMPVFDAIDKLKDSVARWFVVRRKDGLFVGIVSLHEMRMAIAEKELAQLLTIEDITDSFQPKLRPEMSIKEALVSFNQTEAEVLPVCETAESGMKLSGILSRQDALNAYRECAAAAT